MYTDFVSCDPVVTSTATWRDPTNQIKLWNATEYTISSEYAQFAKDKIDIQRKKYNTFLEIITSDPLYT